jgi:hypothetical protein
MLVSGQLLREAANHTLGYSEPSRWADAWAQQFVVYNFASASSSASACVSSTNALRNLGVHVEMVRTIPIFRFDHYSLAERLASLLSCDFPIPTGYPEIGEICSPTNLGEAGEEHLSAEALVRDVIGWLDITYDELSQITGIGRSTLFHWRKAEGSPRVVNSRNIYRVHALASFLVKRLGIVGAQSWLQAGPDRPWDHLIHGDIEPVEVMLRSALFGQRGRNFAARPGIGDEVDLPPLAEPGVAKPLRAKRRPKRGRSGT